MSTNIIKSLTEEEHFLWFIIFADGIATFAGVSPTKPELDPLFAWALQNGFLFAVLFGLVWVATTIWLFRRFKGTLKDAFWYAVVLIHGLGILSWVLPTGSLYTLWVLVGSSWVNLTIAQIAAAVVLAYLFEGTLRRKLF